MTRRTPKAASDTADEDKNSRWRYAIRNPSFRKEFQKLSQLVEARDETVAEELAELRVKWRFEYMPLSIVQGLTYASLKTPEELMLYLEACSASVPTIPVMPIRVRLRTPRGPHSWLIPVNRGALLVRFEIALMSSCRSKPADEDHKTRFYLDVYDRAKDGQIFTTIAQARSGALCRL
jgi:hypothetical protein